MEFNSSRFIAAVGIDILNSVDFRNIFDNRDNSFEIIRFKEINYLLSKELSEPDIAFFSKFGIFVEIFSHLNSK